MKQKKNKILLFFVKTYQKKKKVLYIEKARDNDQKREKSFYMELSSDNDQTNTYISNVVLELQNHSLTFNHKNKSLLLAISLPSRSPMAYNTTSSSSKLTCTDYVDCGKCHERFGQFSWSKTDSNWLDVKLKICKKDDNKEFRNSDWYKMSGCEKQTSTNLCDWGNSWSLQHKTSLETKTCPQLWYQHCPKTWKNKSNRLKRWLK